jgi:hypothetical protein
VKNVNRLMARPPKTSKEKRLGWLKIKTSSECYRKAVKLEIIFVFAFHSEGERAQTKSAERRGQEAET